MDADDEPMFTFRVPMNSARTFVEPTRKCSTSNRTNSIKYFDGRDLFGCVSRPMLFPSDRFPIKKRTKKSFRSTFDRKSNFIDRSMSLIPLDECLTETSSDSQSFVLPPIQSKFEFEETSPWIRRYKSIHRSQRLAELLRDSSIENRKVFSRQ